VSEIDALVALPPVLIGFESGWAPEPIWKTWRRESSGLNLDSNPEPSVVQPITSRYTNGAIPANRNETYTLNDMGTVGRLIRMLHPAVVSCVITCTPYQILFGLSDRGYGDEQE
jgi:hypothetical protein